MQFDVTILTEKLPEGCMSEIYEAVFVGVDVVRLYLKRFDGPLTVLAGTTPCKFFFY